MTNAERIEEIVFLKAKISAAQKALKKLENHFKDSGKLGSWESDLHILEIGAVESFPIAWKDLAWDVGFSNYYLKKHTSYKSVNRLTVRVKKSDKKS